MRSTFILNLFLCACAAPKTQDSAVPPPEAQESNTSVAQEPPEPSVVSGPLPLTGTLEVFVETLSESDIESIAINGHQTLFNDSNEWQIIDEAQSTTTTLGLHQTADALHLDGPNSILLLDGQALIFDGESLTASPINSLLPIPPEKVYGSPESLWFWAAGRLYHMHNQSLSEMTVSGEQITAFAFGPMGTHAIALPELQLVEHGSNGFEGVDYRHELRPDSMVFDKTGTLWVSDGSPILYQRNSSRTWSGLELNEPIVRLMGDAHSGDVWIQTERNAYHHRDGMFHGVSLPDGRWTDVDDYGRLHIATSDGIQRASIEQTIAVAGLSQSATLDGAHTLTFLPMMPESLTSLHAWIDQNPLSIEDNQSAVDSNDYPAGEHVLRVLAMRESDFSITEINFIIGALPDVKWDSEIQNLSEQHCLDCHGEGSFLELHTAQQWEAHIEVILSEILSNEMPKGGPYLSAEEIQLIRGWQNGGFQ